MRIAVVAPARPIDPVVAARVCAFAAIAFPAAELVVHPQCFESEGHFAGSDARRAAVFVEVANDPAIDAIWFARGGYGSNRVLTLAMPLLGPAARAKRYVGYSDTGFLLAALYARGIGRVAHGPMASDIGRVGGDAAVARSLDWLAGGRCGLEPGLGTAPAAAFNLAVLQALVGTPWLPDLTDHVLLVEEVSEPMYRLDRELFQMAHATQLHGIAGVRLGAVTDVVANDPVWAESLETMLPRWCGEMGVPYLGRAEIGHSAANHVVPFGIS
ncbi:MAG: LD-carboxypeptidase [Janthinobacterium lividum]